MSYKIVQNNKMIEAGSNWLSTFITGMANFSAQYNFQSIAIVLIIISQSVCTSDDGNCKQGEQEGWVQGTSSAVIFVGAVIGQLSMGFLGDFLNRSQALSFTLLIATVSAIMSSVTPNGDPTKVYSTIIAFRFFLGVGLGGVYPLSATKSAEDSSKTDEGNGKVNSTGSSWAFFWQIPGLLGPWLLGYFFTFSDLSVSTRWRAILGIGAIPSFLSILGLTYESYLSTSCEDKHRTSISSMSATMRRSLGLEAADPNKHKISLSEVWTQLKDKEIRKNLLACGGSWFLYDVVLYGLGLLAAQIIDDISNNADDNVTSDTNVHNICSKQLIALSLSTPATIVSILILPRMGLKHLQTLSFAIVTVLFLIMAACFVTLRESNPSWLFVLYCLCSMSLNFGVGITTFSMPAALFKQEIRSTFNGIACAMGKTGAILGAYSFYGIAQATDYETVLYICSAVALSALLLTYFAIDQSVIDENTNEGENKILHAANHSSSSPHKKLDLNRFSEVEFSSDSDKQAVGDGGVRNPIIQKRTKTQSKSKAAKDELHEHLVDDQDNLMV